MIQELNSVGCVIDIQTLDIYPKLLDGGYDTYNGLHLDECCDEWFDSLSDEDSLTIDFIRNLKLKQ
jgi:hypothetical protein